MHGSIFRLTLASILLDELGLEVVDAKLIAPASEEALTAWIRTHLSVAVHTVADPDPLDDLERRILALLDPPFNLDKLATTPQRERISELRTVVTRKRRPGPSTERIVH